ncbi:MAG: tRNA pseudouridine(38-40) synthase TruA [Rhodothermales bacterium]|nr:tRNA pseudouridine(38-40) synthase TruA [Rhodothermales bacterium]
MPRFKATVEYDGTGWHGWQTQAGVPTIQESLEQALATALRTPTPVVGSGRTDAGVHAIGQVVHFDVPPSTDPVRLAGQLNGILPRSVAVRDVAPADESFHARFDAVLRTYHYHVSEHPVAIGRSTRLHLRPAPDWEHMNRAASRLVRTADFSAFCRTQAETTNRVCAVSQAAWEEESQPGQWRFRVSADRFLHGMVRAMVGTLLEIGSGRRPADDLERILESRDRREAGPAAPARGLVLARVDYPGSKGA